VAIDTDDVELLKTLVRVAGLDFTGANSLALCWAAVEGSLEVAKFLVDEMHLPIMADASKPDERPLLHAAESCRPNAARVFEFLLSRGAVDQANAYNQSLVRGAKMPVLQCLAAMPDARAVVEVHGGFSELGLRCCALPELTHALERMIGQGFEANDEAFRTACQCGNAAALRILLKHGQPARGLLREALAAFAGALECVDALLAHDPSLFDSSSGDLGTAIERGLVDVVQRLMAHGADVRSVLPGGLVWPLHCAARAQRNIVQMLELLVPLSADVNVRDADDATPLLVLLSRSRSDETAIVEAAALLIKAGADVGVRGEFGETALHLACNNFASPDLLKLLLESGADVNVEDDDDKTPFFSHCFTGTVRRDELFLRMLLDAGAEPDFSAHQLAKYGRWECLQLLADLDLDIDTFHEGLTPLFFAAEAGMLECVKWLVSVHGVDVNRHHRGRTPLMFACRENHIDVALFLVAAGADMNRRAPGGVSALTCAVERGHADMVRALMAAGASAATAARVPSVMSLAVRSGSIFTVCALLAAGVDADNDKHVLEALFDPNPSCEAHNALYVFELFCVLDKISVCVPRTAASFARNSALRFGLSVVDGDRIKLAPDSKSKAARRVASMLDHVREWKLHLVNPRATEICFALQNLQLPALQLLMIVDEACCLSSFVTDHHKWTMITTIKHFSRRDLKKSPCAETLSLCFALFVARDDMHFTTHIEFPRSLCD
jgi:ankyrin repeat protein